MVIANIFYHVLLRLSHVNSVNIWILYFLHRRYCKESNTSNAWKLNKTMEFCLKYIKTKI